MITRIPWGTLTENAVKHKNISVKLKKEMSDLQEIDETDSLMIYEELNTCLIITIM